jgi:hypothetical protein
MKFIIFVKMQRHETQKILPSTCEIFFLIFQNIWQCFLQRFWHKNKENKTLWYKIYYYLFVVHISRVE